MSAARARVVAAAETWLGTPYHHAGRVRGAGVDCLMLLAEVYAAAGIIAPVTAVPHYPPDWFQHRDEERYLAGLTAHAREISGPPRAGDAAVFCFGRTFSHGAIVTAWPRLIHAFVRTGVVRGDATKAPLAGRAVRFFDPFAEAGR